MLATIAVVIVVVIKFPLSCKGGEDPYAQVN